jgi:hypothetical protein
LGIRRHNILLCATKMDDHPFASQCTIQKRELAHDIMGNPILRENGDPLFPVIVTRF